MNVAAAELQVPEKGRVGPNAILQYLPVLESAVGETALAAFLERDWCGEIPDGSSMIDEGEAALFHRCVRRRFPAQAEAMAALAGAATADYIIRHRIPASAKAILAILPAPVAETMLCRAITMHAWTFAGSGNFRVESRSPLLLAIGANPFVRSERSATAMCAWHRAVFRRLFSRVTGSDYRVRELDCCGCGEPSCRFEITRLPVAAQA